MAIQSLSTITPYINTVPATLTISSNTAIQNQNVLTAALANTHLFTSFLPIEDRLTVTTPNDMVNAVSAVAASSEAYTSQERLLDPYSTVTENDMFLQRQDNNHYFIEETFRLINTRLLNEFPVNQRNTQLDNSWSKILQENPQLFTEATHHALQQNLIDVYV